MKLSEDKKSFIRMLSLLILCAAIAVIASAQTKVQVDSAGNYVTLSGKVKTVGIDTGKTLTDSKGNVYPIYRSQSGKMYVLRTSGKTGNIYKQYLKIN